MTSVEFNPADDNYFISGSKDGKVRIWEVHGCRVIDWVDIREIVTAVCYYPSGKVWRISGIFIYVVKFGLKINGVGFDI